MVRADLLRHRPEQTELGDHGTGSPAAEIVHGRADATKPNMGLTSWRGAKPGSADVRVAKNYYQPTELAALDNLVEQYLVFATGQAQRRVRDADGRLAHQTGRIPHPQ